MKDRPILFSAPMVRAILAGTKTQTRRIVKDNAWVMDDCDSGYDGQPIGVPPYIDRFRCPYGQPGDRLWVRETFGFSRQDDDINGRERVVCYRAGQPDHVTDAESDALKRTKRGALMQPNHFVRPPARWITSIHMPRWASRITLEITGVRVERLNDISEDDAKAEGVTSQQIPKPWGHETGWCADWSRVGQPSKYGHDGKSLAASDICHASARHAYWNLWESINGPDSWAANPWVWVVEFRRLA